MPRPDVTQSDAFHANTAENFARVKNNPTEAIKHANEIKNPELKKYILGKITPFADAYFSKIAAYYLENNDPLHALDAVMQIPTYTIQKITLMHKTLTACDTFYAKSVDLMIFAKNFRAAKQFASRIQNTQLKTGVMKKLTTLANEHFMVSIQDAFAASDRYYAANVKRLLSVKELETTRELAGEIKNIQLKTATPTTAPSKENRKMQLTFDQDVKRLLLATSYLEKEEPYYAKDQIEQLQNPMLKAEWLQHVTMICDDYCVAAIERFLANGAPFFAFSTAKHLFNPKLQAKWIERLSPSIGNASISQVANRNFFNS